jgi:uncharacterized protein YcbX
MATTVAALHVYPVKGLKGVDVTEARATARGLEFDRRFMVVDGEGNFLSQREYPKMATIWTDIAGDELLLSAPDADEVRVPLIPTGPATQRVRVWKSVVDAAPVSGEADRFLSSYLGMDCRLVYMPDTTRRLSNPHYAGPEKLVSFADGYAYLVIGTASLADLNRRMVARGQPPLPMNRFRPSIVVEGSEAYAEDSWKEMRVGSARLAGVKPCGRCQVTTTDQSTGEVRGPEPLATLATYRDSAEFGVMFGMNYVTLEAGAIRVGDPINGVRLQLS